jgi:hypothetical protein
MAMFGPKVLKRGFEARAKGHSVGKSSGNPWFMPGAFLVQGQRILWEHDYDHAGDQPDFASVSMVASRAGSRR